MFDSLGNWLTEQGIREASVEEVVQGFGRGLVDAGVSVNQVCLGALLLRPVFGALDVVWKDKDDTISSQMMPRSVVTTEEFQNSPFFLGDVGACPLPPVPPRRGRRDAGFPYLRAAAVGRRDRLTAVLRILRPETGPHLG